MLEIKNVSKSYADKRVLHHIDLRYRMESMRCLDPTVPGNQH